MVQDNGFFCFEVEISYLGYQVNRKSGCSTIRRVEHQKSLGLRRFGAERSCGDDEVENSQMQGKARKFPLIFGFKKCIVFLRL